MRAYLHAIGVENHFVRFGYSSDVRARFSEIQVTCPIDLTILAAMPVGSLVIARELEQSLHLAMAADVLRGEWFRSTPRTRKVVDALKSSDTSAFRLRLATWLKTEFAPHREARHGIFGVDIIGRDGSPKRLDFNRQLERKIASQTPAPRNST